jgi:hypothetical protein
MAAAASESPLALISSAPMLSLMTFAFLRSMSCASADDEAASTAAAATVSCSVNPCMGSATSTVGDVPATTSSFSRRSW